MKGIHPMVLVATWVGLTTCMGCSPGNVESHNIDPQADAVLRDMSRTLGQAKALRFETTQVHDEPLASGQLVQFRRAGKVAMVRPDKLFAHVHGDKVDRLVWHDGGTLTVFDRQEMTYAKADVPSDNEAMIEKLVEKYDLVLPLADLLFRDSYSAFVANVLLGEYLGIHEVQGTPCHHLAFQQEGIDWQIWIDAGTTPLPRKLLIIYSDEPGQPRHAALLDNWELSPVLSKTMFQPRVPDSAKHVAIESLLEIEKGE